METLCAAAKNGFDCSESTHLNCQDTAEAEETAHPATQRQAHKVFKKHSPPG